VARNNLERQIASLRGQLVSLTTTTATAAAGPSSAATQGGAQGAVKGDTRALALKAQIETLEEQLGKVNADIGEIRQEAKMVSEEWALTVASLRRSASFVLRFVIFLWYKMASKIYSCRLQLSSPFQPPSYPPKRLPPLDHSEPI
jgi:small-conductance mechanosensitive channel